MTGMDDHAEIRHRPGFWGWVLLAPLLVWLALFVLAPAIVLLVYSFCSRDALGEVVFDFSWKNYQRVLDPLYLKIFLRSVGYAFLTTVLCVLIGYPAAWFIGRCGSAWRNFLIMLVMVPFLTSFLIRTYSWINILKAEGLLNALLGSIHLIAAPLEILYTPGAVMVGLVYTYLPFMILPIYGSVEKMDDAVVDASLDLGAGPLKTFFTVVLPLTRPGLLAGILFVFVPAIGIFGISDILGGSKVPMIGNVIQNQFLQARDWPFGAALGVALLALFSLLYAAFYKKLEIE